MVQLHPKFSTNEVGEKQVILSLPEFEAILEALDQLDDIRIYDAAKLADNGERIAFESYLEKRNLQ
jgi:hypothetical protein